MYIPRSVFLAYDEYNVGSKFVINIRYPVLKLLLGQTSQFFYKNAHILQASFPSSLEQEIKILEEGQIRPCPRSLPLGFLFN